MTRKKSELIGANVVLRGDVERLQERCRIKDAEIDRLKAAIRWSLGEAPDGQGHWFGDALFEKVPQPKYWWRTHLRNLAGMGGVIYDKERRTIKRIAV